MSSFLSHLYGSEVAPDISESQLEPETPVAFGSEQPHETEDFGKRGEGLLDEPFTVSGEHPDPIGHEHGGLNSTLQ